MTVTFFPDSPTVRLAKAWTDIRSHGLTVSSAEAFLDAIDYIGEWEADVRSRLVRCEQDHETALLNGGHSHDMYAKETRDHAATSGALQSWKYVAEARSARADQLTRDLMVVVDALREIKNKEGKVCADYEICGHRACASSYAAWQIANAALEKLQTVKIQEKSA